jgi:hypothetical protein
MGVTSLRAIAAALTLAASRQRAAAHGRPFKTLVWKNRCHAIWKNREIPKSSRR